MVAADGLATAGAAGVSLVAMDAGSPALEDRGSSGRAGQRPGAFELLVRRYERLCWRHPAHGATSEDTANSARRRCCACTSACQYRHESPLKAWIAQVAWSVAKRHLERRRIPLAEAAIGEDGLAAAIEVADEADVEGERGEAEVGERLQQAIEALPPLQRTVLMLYHLEEVPIGEIAGITGLAEGTIKSHLFRSRQRLRETLEHCGVTGA